MLRHIWTLYYILLVLDKALFVLTKLEHITILHVKLKYMPRQC